MTILIGLVLASIATADTTRSSLNVLFIMTDQHRADAMSCSGSRFVDTPNLDRLAGEGVRFSRAVCASPICGPCRTSILTGEPIHIHEVIGNEQAAQDHCRPGLTTFDVCLARDGYHAEYRGRWHAPPQLLAYEGKPPMVNQVARDYREYLQRLGLKKPVMKAGQFPHPYTGWPYTPDLIDYQGRHAQTGWDVKTNQAGRMYGRDTIPTDHTASAMIADETIEALHRLKGETFVLTS
jgi:arylsulfatase A-like enzyme